MSQLVPHEIKRHPAKVGDYLQYRYAFRRYGVSDSALCTRRVIEVIDDGAKFVMEGFYNINATQIVVHIPMHVAASDHGSSPTVKEGFGL